jgi:pimeloyl-ACP methyl ester carboxylesterase
MGGPVSQNIFNLTFVILFLTSISYSRENSKKVPSIVDDDLTVLTFDQRINPYDPSDNRTFKQRYFINTEYASGTDAPVFLYICGEYECGPDFIDQVALDYAREFGGYLVSLEHRYYGKSQPFSDLSTEHLKYLSADYALKDLDAFQKYLTETLGLTGKWISLGSSYAASLSAYYRSRYPQNVVGALASSAAIVAVKDFDAYDRFEAQVLGPDCQAKAKSVIHQIEAVRNDPSQLAAMKNLFQSDAIVDFDDFVDMVAGVGADSVQYGNVSGFCGALDSASDPLTGYVQMANIVNGGDAVDNSNQAGEILDPNSPASGARQWLYQSCNEFGWWANGYPVQSESLDSIYVNMDYRERLCERLFGLPDAPDVDRHNQLFYEPLLNSSTSNILFTNGSKDPWSQVSISVVNGNANNPNVTYFMIEGASHREDIAAAKDTDPVQVQKARSIFKSLIQKWLAG